MLRRDLIKGLLTVLALPVTAVLGESNPWFPPVPEKPPEPKPSPTPAPSPPAPSPEKAFTRCLYCPVTGCMYALQDMLAHNELFKVKITSNSILGDFYDARCPVTGWRGAWIVVDLPAEHSVLLNYRPTAYGLRALGVAEDTCQQVAYCFATWSVPNPHHGWTHYVDADGVTHWTPITDLGFNRNCGM